MISQTRRLLTSLYRPLVSRTSRTNALHEKLRRLGLNGRYTVACQPGAEVCKGIATHDLLIRFWKFELDIKE